MNKQNGTEILFWCLTLLLLLVLSPVTRAGDEKLLGPLSVENQYPYAYLYTGSAPDSAKSLRPGATTWKYQFDWSNSSTYQRHYTTDIETRYSLFELRRGITDSFDLGVGVPIIWRGGGSLGPVKEERCRFCIPSSAHL